MIPVNPYLEGWKEWQESPESNNTPLVRYAEDLGLAITGRHGPFCLGCEDGLEVAAIEATQ